MTKHERDIKAQPTPAQVEADRIRARKRRQWVERKVAHWKRMGTEAEISPHTGAACPKWKLEADKARAKKLLETCDRQCRRDHNRRAGI